MEKFAVFVFIFKANPAHVLGSVKVKSAGCEENANSNFHRINILCVVVSRETLRGVRIE